jgi:hypothetical protein
VSSPRKILVRRGARAFFENESRLEEFRVLRGFRWGGRAVVHVCAGEFFVPDQDGTCRACRKGGTCRRVRVVVVDLTHATAPKISAGRILRPDEAAERRELDEIVRRLPNELGRELRTFAAEQWDALAPDEIEDLLRIAKSAPPEARAWQEVNRVAWQWAGSEEPVPVTSLTLEPEMALRGRRLAPSVAEELARWIARVKRRIG